MLARVIITPKRGVLDPQGKAIASSLHSLGFGEVEDVRMGKFLELRIADTSWTGVRSPSATRDDLYLFVDGNEDEDDDDQWVRMDITGVAQSAAACGVGAPGWTLSLATAPAAVPVNTPVRLFEEMRFQLQSVGGEWWLAAQSITAGEALTPVLGPLTATGFALQYFDSTGVATADNRAIKSVRVTVQGLTDGAIRSGGSAAAAFALL